MTTDQMSSEERHERESRLGVRWFELALMSHPFVRRGETVEDAKRDLEAEARRIGATTRT